jgi:hypothetical protein
VHITLPEETVREIDRRVGPRGRSGFIARVVESALDDAQRWELIESAIGSIDEDGHEWDPDPVDWVHAERRHDPGRLG